MWYLRTMRESSWKGGAFGRVLLSGLLLVACGSAPAEPKEPAGPQRHVVTGTVMELRGDDVVVLDHDPIPGFMDAMVMPFVVDDPLLLLGVDVGEGVRGTLLVGDGPTRLVGLTVTEALPESPTYLRAPVEKREVPIGGQFPRTEVPLASGELLVVGEGQTTGGPVGVTFIYTRCPIPEFCPLVTARFQALQEQLPKGARLLAVTIDPDYDSLQVLKAYGEKAHAEPGRWDFGRVPKEALVGLAEHAGLTVHGKGTGITHELVLLILDGEGKVTARYEDFDWAMDEVVGKLQP